jgi:hypothetical protein
LDGLSASRDGRAMSLFETINGLDFDRLSSIAQNLGTSPENSAVEDSKASLKSLLATSKKIT